MSQPKHKVVVKTEPLIEPLTLQEIKQHLRLSSGAFSDNYDSDISIAPGSHDVIASYGLIGTGYSVFGYDSLVEVVSGANGTGGTVDIKIQESDDNITFTDWTDGAFTQITGANDNAVYTKAYTGTKQYIRVVSTVAIAACNFGVNIVRYAITSDEDSELTIILSAVRKNREQMLYRKLITQTLQIYFEDFPDGDVLELPYAAPLQSVTSLKYTDIDDVETTFSSDNYYVDTIEEPGRIVLKYGVSWPSVNLRPYKPIVVECVVGYGDNASDVPEPIKLNMLCIIGDAYLNRQESIEKTLSKISFVENLLNQYVIWRA